MKTTLLTTASMATVLTALLTIGGADLRATEEEHWPPPFTAEQIRDEWTQGFWLDTRVTTDAGIKISRTEVLTWSETSAELREAPLQQADTGLQAVGEPGPTQTAQWEQLRDHALFPRAVTERRREARSTVLGELDGWVFRVTGENGAISEFFFADRYPGPPVSFSRWLDGKQIFNAEQVGRSTQGQDN